LLWQPTYASSVRHTHGNMHRSEEYSAFYSDGYHIDISPELRGYKPLRLDTVLKRP
jgi:hypothetical protein